MATTCFNGPILSGQASLDGPAPITRGETMEASVPVGGSIRGQLDSLDEVLTEEILAEQIQFWSRFHFDVAVDRTTTR